ncbi:hypothetical protein BH11MYX2_BH11MYX2_15110 [soil metagenome]
MGLLFKRVRAGTDAVGAWVAARSSRQVFAFGFLVFVLYGFPGYMSTDSYNQLLEARALSFSDGHPPFMAAEWSLLDRIIRGPLLMLLAQGVLFLYGARLIFARVFGAKGSAWASIVLLLYPPVLTCMAVIWKDSQMAAFLLAGTGLILQPRLRTRLFGVGLLVVASLLRHNGMAAVLPIVVLVFEWRSGLRLARRIAFVGGAAIVVIALTLGVSRLLTSSHVRLTPAFSDIVGVIAYTEPRTDEDLRHLLRGTPLVMDDGIQAGAEILCILRGANRITQGDERLFSYPRTDEEWNALNRSWKELVLGDPLAYLAFHWELFARMIGTSEMPRASAWEGFLEAPEQGIPIEHDASPSHFQGWMWWLCAWISDNTPLFVPCVYLFAALLLMLLVSRDRLTFALLSSGVLYTLSFFPAAAEPDYRYSHWAILSISVAIVLLFVERYRRRRS